MRFDRDALMKARAIVFAIAGVVIIVAYFISHR
jgi:hypothetical protein